MRTEEEAARAVEDLETESAAAARARDAVLAAGTRLRTLLGVATTMTTTDRASDSPRARAFTAAPKHTTVHVASRDCEILRRTV